jgi:hypothetical protein
VEYSLEMGNLFQISVSIPVSGLGKKFQISLRLCYLGLFLG